MAGSSAIGFAQTPRALLCACRSGALVLLGFVVGGAGGRSLGHKAVRLLMELGLKGGLGGEQEGCCPRGLACRKAETSRMLPNGWRR